MLYFSINCNLCPHKCNADRNNGETGFCNLDAAIYISSICRHRGEEPPISGTEGICNVFFAHCNLQCVYCQNHQISGNKLPAKKISLEETVNRIIELLDTGISSLGFVSPSHQIPQMISIINGIKEKGYDPVIVYNTNSYDSTETLKQLESYVDVYLADLKYSHDDIARNFSGIDNYNTVAIAAIQEMITQKGTALVLDNKGVAVKGVIIRHLVLPGHTDNSIEVLNQVVDLLNPKISLSLMAQYYPVYKAFEMPPLDREIQQNEYQRVVHYLDFLGFEKGWVQKLESKDDFKPDFYQKHPFEKTK